MQDDKLLTQYAYDGSEAAFGQLVARHLTLVYSTCLRETGSPSQAEDAAQVVFLLLARKAKSLRAGPSLAGWLYTAARFVAKDVRKQEARRRLREEAVMQEVTHRQEPFAPEWEGIEPLLNDALSALKPGERECVLLRFIEGHSLAETGEALGLSEDAARMRVSRAVEKIRRHLMAHGATVTGAVLTGFLTSEAARPAPAQAANVITQGALQALSIGPTANVLLLSKGVYHTMKMTQVKLAALAAVLVLGGTSLPPLARAFNPHKSSVQVPVAPAPLTEPDKTSVPAPAALAPLTKPDKTGAAVPAAPAPSAEPDRASRESLAVPVPLTKPVTQAAGAGIIVLQHTLPSDILKRTHWDIPANLPGGVTQILPLPTQNALAVMATPAGIAKVRELLKTLDIEPRQVQIALFLVSASDADLKASGVEFKLAPLNEPGLKPAFVIYATGIPTARLLQTLTKQGHATQGTVLTTSNDVAASYTLSETPPTQEAEALVFAATPHINGDNSVAIALSPVFSISGVRHEVNTLRTVKNGDTMVIVMPPIASQPDGKDLLLFVTPTIK